jgi:hypothetical protein
MRNVSGPGRPTKFRGEVYALTYIEKMANAVAEKNMKAFAAISLAAFTGLRR